MEICVYARKINAKLLFDEDEKTKQKQNCVPLNINVIENLAKPHTFARTPFVTSNVWTKN